MSCFSFVWQSDCIESIKTSVLYVDGKESMITLDYIVDPSKASDDFTEEGEEPAAKKRKPSEGEVRYSLHHCLTCLSCSMLCQCTVVWLLLKLISIFLYPPSRRSLHLSKALFSISFLGLGTLFCCPLCRKNIVGLPPTLS